MNEHRKSGLLYAIAGLAGSAVLIAFLQWLHENGFNGTHLGASWGLPGALAMIGAVKIVTGVPFKETTRQWDSMPQWKQTLFGFLLLGLALGLVAGVIATYIHFLNG